MEDNLKHTSDCAVHNEPAYPKGECNCGVPFGYQQALKAVGEWLGELEIAFCKECETLYVEPQYVKALKEGRMPK